MTDLSPNAQAIWEAFNSRASALVVGLIIMALIALAWTGFGLGLVWLECIR